MFKIILAVMILAGGEPMLPEPEKFNSSLSWNTFAECEAWRNSDSGKESIASFARFLKVYLPANNDVVIVSNCRSEDRDAGTSK